MKPVAIILLILILLAVWASKGQAQENEEECIPYEYYSCQMPERKLEWACVVEWQWLSDEDDYTFPFALVTTEGDFEVVNNSEVCHPITEDDEPQFTDDRIDWSSFVAAVYQTDTGVEVYCMSEEGDGTLGIIIDSTTPSGATSTCATYYILEDGMYQINLVDGMVYLSDNLWFVGVEYGD